MAWLLTWIVHGLAITAIAHLLLRALRPSAATRYAIWWAALTLVLALPLMRNASNTDSTTTPPSTSFATPSVGATAPDVSGSPGARSTDAGVDVAAPFAMPPLAVRVPKAPDWLIAIAIGAWLGCAMLGLAQLAYSVRTIRRLKASCNRLIEPHAANLPLWRAVRRRGRPVHLKTSDCVRTAAVLGLTRPLIVIPRDLSSSLTAAEVDQVVLHEYAHVQRYDDWTKLLQVIVEAFFGWHPAVRMMLRAIDFEREAACDDWVVETTGAPRAYARCLTKMAGRASGLALAAFPCASASTGHTLGRIERLLDRKRPSGRLAPLPALAGALTLTLVAFCTVQAVPVAIDSPHVSVAALSSAVAEAVTDAARTNATPRTMGIDPSSIAIVDANANATAPLRIARASMLPLGVSLPFALSLPFTRLSAPPATQPAPMMSAPAEVAPIPQPAAHDVHASAPASDARATAAPVTAAAAVPHDTRDVPVPHAELYEIGPMASPADAIAVAEASDAGHLERAWDTARGATARGVSVGTRAAGSATKTATTKAAGGVKTAGAKTARFVGRLTSKLSPF